MDDFNELLVDILSKAYSRIVYNEEKMLKDMIGNQLSSKEIHTLEVIFDTTEKNENTLGTIAKKLGITLSTCTINVDRLIAKKLVEKSKHIDDKRVSYIELTAKGVELLNRYVNMHKRFILKATSALSETEKVALMNAMNKLDF